ncbi:hypothetical protein [Cryobacterium sp. CG_9.6]|uniref:hypothetical protein n=1 Tax=Cryobacterium sp. CG_9.6 TaxID=2760710 RepID=UPI002473DF24|nr:hypothetical protein [Cryobacterium sp. CG_9.6]MDH6235909.1 hypothetical protein [Cryobacterium sp. CG_9.6]
MTPLRAIRTRGIIGHCTEIRPRVRLLAGMPVLDPIATWCQLAAVLGRDDLVAAGDHLLRAEFALADASALADAVAEHAGQRGARGLREAAALVRPRVESRRETHLRLFLLDCGFPEPESNVYLSLPVGKPRVRGDLVYIKYRVLVEYDGEQHRLDDVQFNRDAERLYDVRAAGWLVVTVRKGSSREWVRTAVDEALRSRGWFP